MLSGLNCVIIDDSSFVRKMLEDSIKRLHHNVIASFDSGIEFIDKFDQLDFDLIFLDIILPNMTGMEILKIIMERQPFSKVIVLSGLAQKEIISALLQLGALDFIMKPFEEEKLRDVFLAITTSISSPSAESLSVIELSCHLLNLFFQELLSLSTSIVSKVVQSQIQSVLESLLDQYEEVFDIEPLSMSIVPSQSMWGLYSQEEVFNILKEMMESIKIELQILYSQSFVAELVNSAFYTFCSRPKILRYFDQIDPISIGLPSIPHLKLEYDDIVSSTNFKDYDNSLAISFFVLDDMGPEMVFHLKEKLIDNQSAFKSAIFYFTIISQDTAQYSGVFGPLPVSKLQPDEESNLSAVVYVTTFENQVPALIIIFYKPEAERIISDYNKLNFIIRSRISHAKTKDDILKSQIAGIREDIVKLLAD